VKVAIWVDRSDPFRHDLDLGSSDRLVDRRQLPVHIADADFIQIDEGEAADSGTCECLRRPRAHAPNSDDGDMGLTQPVQRAGPVKPFQTAEPEVVVAHRSANLRESLAL
jgi:hypothetical protein